MRDERRSGVTRRELIRRGMAASAALGLRPTLGAGEAPRPRGVLLLMTDEHNARFLSCAGHRQALTPNLDRLARGGVLFENAVCAYPVCTASRGSLHTGMWPHAHGCHLNVQEPETDPKAGLAPDAFLLASAFHERGYQCRHHGKWHLGDVRRHPCYNWDPNLETAGARAYLDELREWTKAHPVPPDLPPGDWTEPLNWPVYATSRLREFREKHPELPYRAGRSALPAERSYTAHITGAALASIDAADEKPFMITWSDPGPHGPHLCHEPYYSRIDPAAIPYPANLDRPDHLKGDPSCRSCDFLGEEGVREYLRCYCGRIQEIDAQIGRLLAKLEVRGLLDDTLILFTADHGDMCGAHRTAGGKAVWAFYDEIVRVPLIVHWPAGIRAGRRVRTLVEEVDLMPTILDLAGIPIPKQCSGRSLRPLLEGREEPERAAYGEATHPTAVSVRRMVRTQEWKLWFHFQGAPARLPLPEARPMALYHLAEDPGEEHNLAADARYAGVRGKLLAQLAGWMEETRDPWLRYLPPGLAKSGA